MQDAAPIDSAPGRSVVSPPIHSFTLENGMKGVVIQDRRAPVVTHMVWYRVGAADEIRGESGIAHFLEHLMFKGTDSIPSGRFSKIVAENGGQDNAFTSYDYTAYFQRIAKDRLAMVMSMEADRMVNLRLTEEDVATERDVVLEERSTRTDNDPQSLFYEQLQAALYLNHPYGSPVIGWRDEIEKLDREHALAHYQRHYAPDNAILVVAGDVTPEEVEALAKEHYGPLAPAGRTRPIRPQEPPQLAERRIAMTDERVRQPFVTRQYLAPSYRTAEPGVSEAFNVLSEILGGGASGRLYRELVQDEKVALNAGGYYSGLAVDDGTFGLYGVPADGVELEALERRIDAVLARLIEEGPTEDELSRAKMVLISGRIYQQDSQASLARMYGSALTIGMSIEQVRDWPARIEAVDAAAVVAAAKSLDRRRAVTGFLSTAPIEDTAEEAATR
ncbi:MAG: pitrilysin family protein [Pseudomonadota bacterium]